MINYFTSLSYITISMENGNFVFFKSETNHRRITLTIRIQFSLCELTSFTQFVFCLNTDIVRVTFE